MSIDISEDVMIDRLDDFFQELLDSKYQVPFGEALTVDDVIWMVTGTVTSTEDCGPHEEEVIVRYMEKNGYNPLFLYFESEELYPADEEPRVVKYEPVYPSDILAVISRVHIELELNESIKCFTWDRDDLVLEFKIVER